MFNVSRISGDCRTKGCIYMVVSAIANSRFLRSACQRLVLKLLRESKVVDFQIYTAWAHFLWNCVPLVIIPDAKLRNNPEKCFCVYESSTYFFEEKILQLATLGFVSSNDLYTVCCPRLYVLDNLFVLYSIFYFWSHTGLWLVWSIPKRKSFTKDRRAWTSHSILYRWRSAILTKAMASPKYESQQDRVWPVSESVRGSSEIDDGTVRATPNAVTLGQYLVQEYS